MRLGIFFSAQIMMVMGLAAPPAGITILVPADAPTVADAVTVAGNGDTIIVTSAVISESVTVSGPTITIEASPEGTIWNGTGVWCLRSENTADVTARGFVFQNATEIGVGSFLGGSLTIEDCTLQNNTRAGHYSTTGGSLVARRCLFQDNTPGGSSLLSHGGLRFDNSGTTGLIEDCVIVGDQINFDSYGVLAVDQAQVTVRNSVVMGGTRGVTAGGSGTLITATGNVFAGNTSAIWLNTSATINAGNLGNMDPNDDGGNLFFPDHADFLNNSGGTLIGEGNLFPRIDSGYISGRVTAGVDFDPAFQVVIDRVSADPSGLDFLTPIPDGQFIEIRAVSSEPSSKEIDISGWLLSDDPSFDLGDEGFYAIPASTEIQPDESILFAYSLTALDAHFDLDPTAQMFEMMDAPLIDLDPAGDEVFLTPNPVGIHDSFLYGAEDDTVAISHWLGSRRGLSAQGSVYGRHISTPDTNTVNDWVHNYPDGRVAITTLPVDLSVFQGD